MILANIINLSKKAINIDEIIEHNLFPYLGFNEIKYRDGTSINFSLPTLYIEYNTCVQLFPWIATETEDLNDVFEDYENTITVLKNKIDDKTYWSYSYKENRNQFYAQFKNFLNSIPDLLLTNTGIETEIIDTVFNKNICTEELLYSYLETITKDIVYFYNNCFYFYSIINYKIYVLDLNFFIFVGYNTEAIKSYFATKSIKYFNDSEDKKIHNFFLNLFPDHGEIIEKYIPYLISLK